MTQPALYTLRELADAAGVTPRTVRFYIAEELLLPPDTRGRYTLYTEAHLNRLRLIGRLKAAFLPLTAIRTHLEALTDAQVQALLEREEGVSSGSPQQEADFERAQQRLSLTTSPQEPKGAVETIAGFLAAAGQTASEALARIPVAHKRGKVLLVSPRLREPATPPPDDPAVTPDVRDLEDNVPTEDWKRIVLAPGIELHVRLPASPAERARILRFIAETKARFRALE